MLARGLISVSCICGSCEFQTTFFQKIVYQIRSIGNILDFPGFDKLLHHAVTQAIHSLMVLPQAQCIKIDRRLDTAELLNRPPIVNISFT